MPALLSFFFFLLAVTKSVSSVATIGSCVVPSTVTSQTAGKTALALSHIILTNLVIQSELWCMYQSTRLGFKPESKPESEPESKPESEPKFNHESSSRVSTVYVLPDRKRLCLIICATGGKTCGCAIIATIDNFSLDTDWCCSIGQSNGHCSTRHFYFPDDIHDT